MVCLHGAIATMTLQLIKVCSHSLMCDYNLLYQEMECCLRFSDFVHTVWWLWMWFAMYLHWNHTSQLHRMGVEPNCVRCHTHHCIARWNHTIWTPSLTSTQSIFCIAVANKKIVPRERTFSCGKSITVTIATTLGWDWVSAIAVYVGCICDLVISVRVLHLLHNN